MIRRKPFLIALAALLLCSEQVRGTSATWAGTAVNGDWHNIQNWTPATVPNGSADTASFGLSNVTALFLSANTEVAAIVFNAGASAYTIDARASFRLTISGSGITNGAGFLQDFIASTDNTGNSGTIEFRQNASAGSATRFTANGSQVSSAPNNPPAGAIYFRDASNAANALFTVNGGTVGGANGGFIGFCNNSSGGMGVFTANGGAVLDAQQGRIEFFDTATAGQGAFTNQGSSVPIPFNQGVTLDGNPLPGPDGVIHLSLGAEMQFHQQSTAGEATFTNNGGSASSAGGSRLRFRDSSTAGNANITNNGGTASSANGGFTGFYENSSAGTATIINNPAAVGAVGGFNGGSTLFSVNSSAGAAILIANSGLPDGAGGRISFVLDSDGGTASVMVFGNGSLAINDHNDPGVTIGSLEGSGIVYLGSRNLSVGSNNQSTLFSGLMRDGGPLGTQDLGGSLTKIGAGTLTLSGTNTYTGATTIEAGKLILNGSITSAVTVNGGTLGGSGTVRGITVNSGGTLSPGDGVGILYVVGNLTLSLGATYLVDLNGTAVGTRYDQTNVAGAVGLGSAALSLRIGFTPAAVDLFTILNNDGTDAVSGTFNGLAEGATFTAEGQTFTISYQGGDGNDVVLTSVVPEPATWVLLSAGIAFVALSVRRRRRISEAATL